MNPFRLVVVSGLAAAVFLAAPASVRAAPEPCIFTSDELAALIGQPLLPPVVKPPKFPYSVYCTFEADKARGKKLIVSIRAKESKEEFAALQKLARMTNKEKYTALEGIGRGAYVAPHGMRVWDGQRSLYVNGLTGILKREITPADASALLKLGLERMPPPG